MLELSGTPQDIVDFRRKLFQYFVFTCPHCGDEMDPRGSILDDKDDFRFICWD